MNRKIYFNTQTGEIYCDELELIEFEVAPLVWGTSGITSPASFVQYAYGDGTYVVAYRKNGGYSNIYYSTNEMVSWTLIDNAVYQDDGFSPTFNFADYKGGKYIFGGVTTTGKVIYSSDHLNWYSGRTWDVNTACNVRDIDYYNNVYVAVGSGGGGKIAYSNDCNSWTTAVTTGHTFCSMLYGGGKFSAINIYQVGSLYRGYIFYTSTDGINWTNVGNGGLPQLTGFTNGQNQTYAYGNNKYVCFNYHNLLYSDDAINWNYFDFNSQYGISEDYLYPTLIFSELDNNFYLNLAKENLGYDSQVWISNDGINWSVDLDPANATWWILNGNNKIVVPSLNPNSTVYIKE